jgi:peptidoglycan/xylan/chitin deacetylase (PgdA/CDA1 family)
VTLGVSSIARKVAGGPPTAALVGLLERIMPGSPDTLAVLTFHRVCPPRPDVVPGLLSATPTGFAALLEALRQRHAILGIDEVLRRADGGPALPRRALLLTFDDAYGDFADHAWPALRERGLPGLQFVPTAFPDAPERTFWWERVHAAVTTTKRGTIQVAGRALPLETADQRSAAYRAVRDAFKALPHERLVDEVERVVNELAGERPGNSVLGWTALREMSGEGLALAPHTRTHPLLPRLDPTKLDGELSGSRADLARMTGSDVAAFAYPAGAASRGVVAAVADAGFRVAFTTARGVNDLRAANWLLLKRINVSVRTPASLIRGQVLA